MPLATIQGAGEEQSTYWYQCDQIGAPLEPTDEQGQVAWAADYKVWGEAVCAACCETAPMIGRSARGRGVQSAQHHLRHPHRTALPVSGAAV
ncbi:MULTISPECIES: RHS domain-containing protein [Delftia]|uniref:RHS domain-containing protein n=1 Tax=Delftia sp. (strain Cs1-4) TaxID=742013 RepID=UPI0009FE17D6|nr:MULTISPECIES: RHS domain-containing protein [Delftia]